MSSTIGWMNVRQESSFGLGCFRRAVILSARGWLNGFSGSTGTMFHSAWETWSRRMLMAARTHSECSAQ